MNALLPRSPGWECDAVSQHPQQGSLFQREPAKPPQTSEGSAKPQGSRASSHAQDGFSRQPLRQPPATPNMAPQEHPGAGPRTEVGVTGTEAEPVSEERQPGSGRRAVRCDDSPSGGFRPAAGDRGQAEEGEAGRTRRTGAGCGPRGGREGRRGCG